MKNHLPKAIVLLGLFVSTLLGLNITNDVSAETLGIGISPAEFVIELKPGQAYIEEFTVENRGDEDVSYRASISPYQQLDLDNGETEASYTTKNEYTEIVDWIQFIEGEEGTIPVGEKVRVKFSIHVPDDAPGGGQYAVPFITTTNNETKPTDGSALGQSLSGGPVIYASIDGVTRREGVIKANDIDGFLLNPPFRASTTVTNSGNIHTYATQVMKVYPMFSSESIYNNEESPATFMVLPGNTKYNAVNWTADQGAPSIGIYKVISEVRIFDETSTTERTVIVCPMWVLILIIVFILAVIFWIVARVRSRKQS